MFHLTSNERGMSISACVCLCKYTLISPRKLYEQVQYMLPTFFLIWYHDVMVGTRGPRRLATLSCMGTMLTTVKEGFTKVVNDLQVNKDRGTQTKTEAKETEDRALLYFCHHILHCDLSLVVISKYTW